MLFDPTRRAMEEQDCPDCSSSDLLLCLVHCSGHNARRQCAIQFAALLHILTDGIGNLADLVMRSGNHENRATESDVSADRRMPPPAHAPDTEPHEQRQAVPAFQTPASVIAAASVWHPDIETWVCAAQPSATRFHPRFLLQNAQSIRCSTLEVAACPRKENPAAARSASLSSLPSDGLRPCRFIYNQNSAVQRGLRLWSSSNREM